MSDVLSAANARSASLALASGHLGADATVADYIALLKPRVMSLVVFSGFVGLMVAPGHLHPLLGFVVILSIALSAGGSAAVNMWYDRDIDAIMTRTQKRPLPQGRMMPATALEFGGALIFGSTFLMTLTIGWLAGFLLAFASAFYILVYTMGLKRRTPQNIVIGGAAGAFPPVIAWAAVTGHVAMPAILLFLIIFVWTPPHFWALALYRNDDYTRARVPMMPVIAGPRSTKIQMLIYTLILFPLSLTPSFVGIAGKTYLVGAAILSALFIVTAVRVLRDDTHKAARQMFGFSLLYLTLLFGLLLIDPLLRLLS